VKTSEISELIKMGNEKETIRINPGEYGFTMDPDKVLYTTNLDYCVGLGLVEDVRKNRKRGLAHIFGGGDKKSKDSKGRLVASKESIQRVDSVLTSFVGDFKGKMFQNIKDFRRMYSLIVFSRPFYGNTESYENPMATHIMNWLLGHDINLKKIEDINDWDAQAISHKDMALHHNKLAVLYRNSRGKLLNYGNTDEELENFEL